MPRRVRARRIAHGAETMIETENDKPTVIALREIAEGHITPTILEEIDQPAVEEFMQAEDQSRCSQMANFQWVAALPRSAASSWCGAIGRPRPGARLIHLV